MQRVANRVPLFDVVKGLACCLIVWHHLAFYGPMSDVAYALVPKLMQWLYDYGRMAVQVFLVLGGYLAAASLAPNGQVRAEAPLAQIGRRYFRLVLPYLAALAVCVLVSAGIRAWAQGPVAPAVPGSPDVPQLIAHVLLMQDTLGYEALSAGVWYVAIDFQLFVLAVGMLALTRWLLTLRPHTALAAYAAPAATLVLTVASLFWFNLETELDTTGLYFMGAYGMGMLAYWSSQWARPSRGLWLLAVLGTLALWLDFRGRILVALLTALALGGVGMMPALRQWNGLRPLQRLGQMSYSVFLIHFSVCLLVNQGVSAIWPELPWHNLAGMGLAFVLSLLCGRGLFVLVEQRSHKLQASSWHMPAGGLLAASVLFAAAQALP
ncbi:acyltransferase family protein [Variovorax sp. HJSM1_2]|uniref:acyltransferase family protein n=1 Tax=Variovorax sp. HJSM1_2 TaxID=3366263 RepID=UPI003BBE24C2